MHISIVRIRVREMESARDAAHPVLKVQPETSVNYPGFLPQCRRTILEPPLLRTLAHARIRVF